MAPLDLLLAQSDPVNALLVVIVWQRINSRLTELRSDVAYNRRWLVRATDTPSDSESR